MEEGPASPSTNNPSDQKLDFLAINSCSFKSSCKFAHKLFLAEIYKKHIFKKIKIVFFCGLTLPQTGYFLRLKIPERNYIP